MPYGPEIVFVPFACAVIALFGLIFVIPISKHIAREDELHQATCAVSDYEPPTYTPCWNYDQCFHSESRGCHSIACDKVHQLPAGSGLCCSDDYYDTCVYEVGICKVLRYSSNPLIQNFTCPLHVDDCLPISATQTCYINEETNMIQPQNDPLTAEEKGVFALGILLLLPLAYCVLFGLCCCLCACSNTGWHEFEMGELPV